MYFAIPYALIKQLSCPIAEEVMDRLVWIPSPSYSVFLFVGHPRCGAEATLGRSAPRLLSPCTSPFYEPETILRYRPWKTTKGTPSTSALHWSFVRCCGFAGLPITIRARGERQAIPRQKAAGGPARTPPGCNRTFPRPRPRVTTAFRGSVIAPMRAKMSRYSD